jgi:hypothetical protein
MVVASRMHSVHHPSSDSVSANRHCWPGLHVSDTADYEMDSQLPVLFLENLKGTSTVI